MFHELLSPTFNFAFAFQLETRMSDNNDKGIGRLGSARARDDQ